MPPAKRNTIADPDYPLREVEETSFGRVAELLEEDEDDMAVIREREKGKFLSLDELKKRHGWG